jgi:hypothetical protein
MENDLKARHQYYQALAGKYEGKLSTVSGTFNIRITLLPSIPPYAGERERQISEVENDINNLYFYVQIVQWHPDSTASAVGCKLAGIKPNQDTGYFILASSECSNLYQFYLSVPGGEAVNIIRDRDTSEMTMENKQTVVSRSSSISQAIKKGEIHSVDRLVGMLQPSTIAEIYSIDVKRTE